MNGETFSQNPRKRGNATTTTTTTTRLCLFVCFPLHWMSLQLPGVAWGLSTKQRTSLPWIGMASAMRNLVSLYIWLGFHPWLLLFLLLCPCVSVCLNVCACSLSLSLSLCFGGNGGCRDGGRAVFVFFSSFFFPVFLSIFSLRSLWLYPNSDNLH